VSYKYQAETQLDLRYVKEIKFINQGVALSNIDERSHEEMSKVDISN
jgi:hypothetical protein